MKDKEKQEKVIENKEEPASKEEEPIIDPKEMFMFWCALPKPLRVPQTIEKFAEKYNIGEATLYRWKKEDGFWDEVSKLRVNTFAREKTSNVIQSLYNKILKNGNATEVKLWMQIFEGFTEKTKSEIDTSDPIKQLMKQIYDARKSPVRPESKDPRGIDNGGPIQEEDNESTLET